MAYAQILSRGTFGIEAPQVQVEVHLSRGLPALNLVGLAGAEVKESKERVRSAILNSGFEFPAKRITINLAPADLPKSGGRYDLAIAIGILVASGQAPDKDLDVTEFVSELSLDGRLKPVGGIVQAAVTSYSENRQLVVAPDNQEEALVSGNKQVISAPDLQTFVKQLFAEEWSYSETTAEPVKLDSPDTLSQVKGNEHALRAMTVAAAGGHNLLMVGSPGSGKTMLATGFASLLPKLTDWQARQVAQIESVSYVGYQPGHWHAVRVRSPHHSCSSVAMVGGGKVPTPGEISLAHHGVLFLDELPEFKRASLESLRQPMEQGSLSVSRAGWKVDFPARFQLLAAMNPCPCGYFGSATKTCHCPVTKIQQYLGRVSGPLLDRIDIQIQVSSPSATVLDASSRKPQDIQKLQKTILGCRDRQYARQQQLNSRLSSSEITSYMLLTEQAERDFKGAIEQMTLSMRAQERVLRLALTITDLNNAEQITSAAIAEALSYRAYAQLQKKLAEWL